MESLPLLPGYIFPTSLHKDHYLRQKLRYQNGFPMIFDSFNVELKPEDILKYDPCVLIYKRKCNNDEIYERFLPQYVLYANKCLSFDAYFQEKIYGSQEDKCRSHKVKIVYYLENDTMGITEFPTENSRLYQGKLVKRSKIRKKDGEYFHWKDLNVGINLEIYGVTYRMADCDAYTREFLTSQGIDVGDPENIPIDNYVESRKVKQIKYCNPPRIKSADDDKLLRFLQYDNIIFSFDAVWNDELYLVQFFLVDNTISLVEVRQPNDGKTGKKLILKRARVPKRVSYEAGDWPSAYLEKDYDYLEEYYSAGDMKVGNTIYILGRKVFLYDCDLFTRNYYHNNFGITQPQRIMVDAVEAKKPQTCQNDIYKEPSRFERAYDNIRKLYNFNKCLRYSLLMNSVHEQDNGREFIMEYHLADGTIRINEKPKTNSGRRVGCFLNWNLVPKPETTPTVFYTPEDFYIGAKINIFQHHFTITGADFFVYKYIEDNPDKFDQNVKDNIRKYFIKQNMIKSDDPNEATSNQDTNTEPNENEVQTEEKDE